MLTVSLAGVKAGGECDVRGTDMLGQAFLRLSHTQRRWQHLTALLGSLKFDPPLEWWHVTLSSGPAALSFRGKGAWVLPAVWVTLVKPLALTIPQFPNLPNDIGLR